MYTSNLHKVQVQLLIATAQTTYYSFGDHTLFYEHRRPNEENRNMSQTFILKKSQTVTLIKQQMSLENGTDFTIMFVQLSPRDFCLHKSTEYVSTSTPTAYNLV